MDDCNAHDSTNSVKDVRSKMLWMSQMQFVLRAFDKEPRQLAGLRGKDFPARKSRSSRSLRSANVEEESYEMRLGFKSDVLTRSYSWSMGMVN